MKNSNEILNLIEEADSYAHNKAAECAHKMDPDAQVRVYKGEVYIKSEILEVEDYENIQATYDKAFVEKTD